MNKRILLGLHHESIAEMYTIYCEEHKYEYRLARCVEEVLDELSRGERYTHIVMDANLGYPGSDNVWQAQRVYDRIRHDVERGVIRFATISGNLIAVENARKLGILAEENVKFQLEFFDLETMEAVEKGL